MLMKKIIACGLILTMFGSLGTVCFASNGNFTDPADWQVDDHKQQYEQAAAVLNGIVELRDEYKENMIKFRNDYINERNDPEAKRYISDFGVQWPDHEFMSTLNKIHQARETLREIGWCGDEASRAISSVEIETVRPLSTYAYPPQSVDISQIHEGLSKENNMSTYDYSTGKWSDWHPSKILYNYYDEESDRYFYFHERTDVPIRYVCEINNEFFNEVLEDVDAKFDKIAEMRDSFAAKAQILSDELIARGCIAFAQNWGYEE